MCYCPTPTLHLNLALTGDGAFLFSLKKTHSVWFISVLNSGGPLSALTCCVNVRLLSGDKKNIAVNLFSKLGWEMSLYYASYDDFHPDILARMYT